MNDKKSCENCGSKDCTESMEIRCGEPCVDWQRNPDKWLAITPTESGWYWLKEANRQTQIVEVNILHHHVYRSGTECFDEIKDVRGEWQGPIVPKEDE